MVAGDRSTAKEVARAKVDGVDSALLRAGYIQQVSVFLKRQRLPVTFLTLRPSALLLNSTMEQGDGWLGFHIAAYNDSGDVDEHALSHAVHEHGTRRPHLLEQTTKSDDERRASLGGCGEVFAVSALAGRLRL
jgi:hypothetical protein